MKKILLVGVVGLSTLMAGCAPNVDKYRANSYSTNQLNQQQEMELISILSVTPAQVMVDNSANAAKAQKAAAVFGAILGGLAAANNSNSKYAGATGAVGGAAIGGGVAGMVAKTEVMVDGVTIGYQKGDRLFTSTQVGLLCEFKQGTAMSIGSGSETRVQPNATCPVKE